RFTGVEQQLHAARDEPVGQLALRPQPLKGGLALARQAISAEPARANVLGQIRACPERDARVELKTLELRRCRRLLVLIEKGLPRRAAREALQQRAADDRSDGCVTGLREKLI